VAGHVANHTSI